MRRRLIGLAMASVLLATACGSTATPAPATAGPRRPDRRPRPRSRPQRRRPPSSPSTLRYCWGGEGEVKAMEKVIQAWNSAHPEIQVKGISGNIKTEEIAAAVAGGAPPDMVIMCDNGAIAGFAHDKVIQPLDDILTKINADKSDIIPASLKWLTYQGKLYGLPFGQDTWGLYYNTDMFTAAGLDPTKPPTTPDQLWDYAAKLTKLNADGSIARRRVHPRRSRPEPRVHLEPLQLPVLRRSLQQDHRQQPRVRRVVQLVQEVVRHLQQEERADQPHLHPDGRRRGPHADRPAGDGDLRRVGERRGLPPDQRTEPPLRHGADPGDQPGQVRCRVHQRQRLVHPDRFHEPGGRGQVRHVPHDRRSVADHGHPERQRAAAHVAPDGSDADGHPAPRRRSSASSTTRTPGPPR